MTKKSRRKNAQQPAKSKSGESAADGTRTRILDAAEEIFADVGFDAASMRRIAAEARVPVALVSYHYEGKLGLYREVFRARYPRAVEQRKAGLALAALEEDPRRRLEMILKAVLVPMLTLRSIEGTSNFGTLMAREANDPKAAERGIIGEMFDGVAKMTIGLLKKTLPDRNEAEIVWAFQMMIGTMVYIMGDTGRTARLSGGAADPKDTDATIRVIVALLRDGIAGSSKA
jgi:AcrR family transcriptional regulator